MHLPPPRLLSCRCQRSQSVGLCQNLLPNSGLVTQYVVEELSHHWFRRGLGTCSEIHHRPLTRYVNCGLRICREYRKRFPTTADKRSRQASSRHVPWCMPGSLTSDFLCNKVRGKRYRHFWCMRKPQFYVSGKRPIVWINGNCQFRLKTATPFTKSIWKCPLWNIHHIGQVPCFVSGNLMGHGMYLSQSYV